MIEEHDDLIEMQPLRDLFAEELDRVGEIRLAAAVRIGADNSHGGTAAIEAMTRAIRRERIQMGKFKPIISVGVDKNGEIDFRVNMSIASMERPRFNELCQMMAWAIKEALTLWLQHGPSSKEMAAQAEAR